MTERQALKVSGLLDELRKRAEGMGFAPEQIETALVVTGLSPGEARQRALQGSAGLPGEGARRRSFCGRKQPSVRDLWCLRVILVVC